MTRVRLGVDRELAEHERVVDLLGPLLPPAHPPQWVHRAHGRAIAAGYAEHAASWFEVTTDLDACDVAVLAVGWEQLVVDPDLARPSQAFCRAAANAGKAVLVFVDGDDHVPSPGDNAVVFRTSLDRRRRTDLDVALPAWIRDPGPQTPRPHRVPPIVGFCGQAAPLHRDGRRISKEVKFYGRVALTKLGVVERIGKHPAFAIRPRAIRALRESSHVELDLRLRDSMTRLDVDRDAEVRFDEFVASLAASDYVLCVRGEGNYSYRLYEALAAARLPLYVDTDAVLPLEGTVPWDDLLLRVPARDVRHVGDRVTSEHTATSPERFEARQLAARQAWDAWLSMAGYFGTLHQALSRERTRGTISPAPIAAAMS